MVAAFSENYRFLALRRGGAFFGSIHQTLTYLVLADKMWLHRFASQQTIVAALSSALLALPDGSDYSSDLHPDWHDLRQTRGALDEVIEQWLAAMGPDFLASTMRQDAQKTGEGVEA